VLSIALSASSLASRSVRDQECRLAEAFRTHGLRAIAGAAALALVALLLASQASPPLFHGLTHRALPEVLAAVAGLAGAHLALNARRVRLARAMLGLAVVAVMWGWALAQYPRIVGARTVSNSAATAPELTAVTVALAAGLLLLAPALWFLHVTFRPRSELPT
jgi:cytochrome d ubiquinol oxidase subunit II